MLRSFATVALIAGMSLPIWKAYTLHASVDHIRDSDGAVPFFAYYRYGFMPDSVVFNVNARSCASVVHEIIPTFRHFVTTMQDENPREIRLAWQGETLAVVQRSTMETIWHQTAWSGDIALGSLDDTIECSLEDDLYFDWESLLRPSSTMT